MNCRLFTILESFFTTSVRILVRHRLVGQDKVSVLPMHVPRYNRMQHRVSVEVWKVFLELTPRLGALAASPEDIMYLLKSLSCQINIQFPWNRKLAPLTVIFLVSCQPRFHAALFKYIFRSTKVDFVVFTLTLYF